MNFFTATSTTILATFIATTLSAPASSRCLAPMTRDSPQPYIITLKPGITTSSQEASELKDEIRCQRGIVKDTFQIGEFQAFSVEITDSLASWIPTHSFNEFVQDVERDGKVTTAK